MRRNFRTYDLAVEFYRESQTITLARHLKEQLDRAASSVVLNLAEGSGRGSAADQVRFYLIAFGSLRECQAILDLQGSGAERAVESADRVGAHLYNLIKRLRGR